MAVPSELASMLEAVDDPALLIRAEDKTVACVNTAFRREFGAFQFEGKLCWETLHRATDCAECGLGCPLTEAVQTRRCARVEQTLYTSAHVTKFAVSVHPVLGADARVRYWLERIAVQKGSGLIQESRGHVGISTVHQNVVRKMAQAAAGDAPVLICGESGIGKDLYARTVHENSSRASQPFVTIDGKNLTDEGVRKVLFGTKDFSTSKAPDSLIARASGGTFFISNVEQMSDEAARLIVAMLSQGEMETRSRQPSFRLMASLCTDLGEGESIGKLPREFADLFRSNMIHVAPLRERKEDIAPLARHFIRGIAPYNTYRISEGALDVLTQCNWVGNMRALRDVLQEAAIRCDKKTIRREDIVLREDSGRSDMFVTGAPFVKLETLRDRYLLWALREFKGSRADLAKNLGVSQRTLYRLAAMVKDKNTETRK